MVTIWNGVMDILYREVMSLCNRIDKGEKMINELDESDVSRSEYIKQLEHLKTQLVKARTCLKILDDEQIDFCILSGQELLGVKHLKQLCQLRYGEPESGDCNDCEVYKQIKEKQDGKAS